MNRICPENIDSEVSDQPVAANLLFLRQEPNEEDEDEDEDEGEVLD